MIDHIKTEEQLNIMRKNGKILASILLKLYKEVVPGTPTWELEKEFIRLCKEYGVRPACKGYAPFSMPAYPTGLCVSINSEAVHCPPKQDYIIQDGDLVTVDTVIENKGLHVDAAFCKAMPNASKKRKSLAKTAELAFFDSVAKVKDGIRTGVIGNKMYKTAKRYGFDVLRDYAGHGIGTAMHEWPEIACHGHKTDGVKLEAGLTICIEALICSGKPNVRTFMGKWNTEMADGRDFCQFEHTILVTRNGYEIITLP